MASMIAAHGAKAAQSWAEKLVANLARKPQGNDRAQAKAIFQGICDVAIMNSYYYGNMKFNDDAEQRSWADAIRLVFTNQADRGNHINISGGGVAKHSRNKQQAVAFLEFLTGEVAQQLYGTVNYEYPVNPAVAPPAELASWGPFKRDKLPIERLAELAPQAQMIIDRVGW
jgi:iron(III) transport system substrate-binding protein